MSNLIRRGEALKALLKVPCKIDSDNYTWIRLSDAFGTIDEDVPSVELERKWIPVTEALPKNYEQTICIDSRGKMMIGMYGEYGWTFPCYMTEPVAWMPLPEPAVIGDVK